MNTHRPLPRLTFGPNGPEPSARILAEEVAVAISYNGTTQAVMMATPADLTDFARGFTVTEGIATLEEVEEITIQPAGDGIDVQIWLAAGAEARLSARRRKMAGPVGCGLCGIDSIDQALREQPPVAHGARLSPDDVLAAVAALPAGQSLHDATRAAHAAGFWADGRMVALREDVGRHNALDKLAGAIVGNGAGGAVVMTSRISIDLVQKCAAIGAGVLIAVSAPTAAAVELAERLGITLIANARTDRFDLYSHSDRIVTKVPDVR